MSVLPRLAFVAAAISVAALSTSAEAAPPLEPPPLPELPALPGRQVPVPADAPNDVPAASPADRLSLMDTYDALVAAMAPSWAEQPEGPEGKPIRSGGLALSEADVEALGDFDANSWLSNLSTPDGQRDAAVAGKVAQWAAEFDQTAGKPESPEALVAGLLTTRAVQSFAVSEPDLFAQVRSSGLGSSDGAAAWQTSLAAANSELADGGNGLLDRCSAGLLEMMATGDASSADSRTGGDCRPCLATGAFLHSKLDGLFTQDGSGAFTTSLADQVIPPSEFNQLPAWQRQLFSEDMNNTAISTESLSTAPTCSGSTQAGADVVAGVFGVFGSSNAGTASTPATASTSNSDSPFARFGER